MRAVGGAGCRLRAARDSACAHLGCDAYLHTCAGSHGHRAPRVWAALGHKRAGGVDCDTLFRRVWQVLHCSVGVGSRAVRLPLQERAHSHLQVRPSGPQAGGSLRGGTPRRAAVVRSGAEWGGLDRAGGQLASNGALS